MSENVYLQRDVFDGIVRNAIVVVAVISRIRD